MKQIDGKVGSPKATTVRGGVVGIDDLTKAALKRLVAELMMANEDEEQDLLSQLTRARKKADKERNDLADLDEEMHGKPKTPAVKREDDEEEDS